MFWVLELWNQNKRESKKQNTNNQNKVNKWIPKGHIQMTIKAQTSNKTQRSWKKMTCLSSTEQPALATAILPRFNFKTTMRKSTSMEKMIWLIASDSMCTKPAGQKFAFEQTTRFFGIQVPFRDPCHAKPFFNGKNMFFCPTHFFPYSIINQYNRFKRSWCAKHQTGRALRTTAGRFEANSLGKDIDWSKSPGKNKDTIWIYTYTPRKPSETSATTSPGHREPSAPWRTNLPEQRSHPYWTTTARGLWSPHWSGDGPIPQVSWVFYPPKALDSYLKAPEKP